MERDEYFNIVKTGEKLHIRKSFEDFLILIIIYIWCIGNCWGSNLVCSSMQVYYVDVDQDIWNHNKKILETEN